MPIRSDRTVAGEATNSWKPELAYAEEVKRDLVFSNIAYETALNRVNEEN